MFSRPGFPWRPHYALSCSAACSQSLGPCLSRLLRLASPLVWRSVRTAVVPGSARIHNRAVNGEVGAGLRKPPQGRMSQRQTKSPCHGGCYSHLRLAGVAGASRESRWCDLGESQVRLGQVAGATQESRWCDSGQSLVRLWRGAGCSVSTQSQTLDAVATHLSPRSTDWPSESQS